MFSWSRFGGYEVSSKGDNRFSALNALLSDNRTIEMHYQCDVKGFLPGGRNWRLGKGKPPINKNIDLWEGYLNLWRSWINRHPNQFDELRLRAEQSGYILSDRFATSDVNQARALAYLLNESLIKPQLATDIDLDKITFPLYGQPKIDGVRGLNISGKLVGRSLKKHEQLATTNYYSDYKYIGLDGELVYGNQTDSDLCSNTSSLLSTITAIDVADWYVFDYVTPDTLKLKYADRYELLRKHVEKLANPRIKLVPYVVINNMDELLAFEAKLLLEGYEGAIYRNPEAVVKQGRSTKLNELVRLKRFIEEEAIVIEILEGNKNNNEAKKNELGRTERSTHKENMEGNSMVGTLICQTIKDIYDPYIKGKLLFKKGLIFSVAPGKMTEAERIYYFFHQEELINKLIKFQFFPKGIKDLPRFPTFQSLRIQSDIGDI